MNPHSQTLGLQPTHPHNHARYDALYRLTSAVTNGSANYAKWGLTWTYDRYGNRLGQNSTYDTPPMNSLSFANPGGAQTNHPDGMCFDANGNLTAESGTCPPAAPTYTWDAANRLVNYRGSQATYVYDGNNLRVKKVTSTTTTVYIYASSKVIAEYDNGAAPSSPSREYVFMGGALLTKIESGTSTYFHQDHLSNRVLTDSNGNVIGQLANYPWGEQWYSQNTTTKWTFATYERDSESSNDYALARYYINRFGRFLSPDPIAGNPANPQSQNLYAYAGNDPINHTDPTGLLYWFVIPYIPHTGIETEFDDLPVEGVDEFGNPTRILVQQYGPPEPPDLGLPPWMLNPPNLSNIFGPTPQPAPPPGYEKCITAALEEVLAFGEGTANAPNGGYGLLVYGTVMSAHGSFTSLKGMTFGPGNPFTIDNPELAPGHPQIFVQPPGCSSPRCWSSAFGRFQITYTTATNNGFTDFSPAGQREAAATMLNPQGRSRQL